MKKHPYHNDTVYIQKLIVHFQVHVQVLLTVITQINAQVLPTVLEKLPFSMLFTLPWVASVKPDLPKKFQAHGSIIFIRIGSFTEHRKVYRNGFMCVV